MTSSEDEIRTAVFGSSELTFLLVPGVNVSCRFDLEDGSCTDFFRRSMMSLMLSDLAIKYELLGSEPFELSLSFST